QARQRHLHEERRRARHPQPGDDAAEVRGVPLPHDLSGGTMAQLVHSDSVFRVEPGRTPDYDADNSLMRLLGIVEQVRLIAAREVYDPTSLQYLFPLTYLQLY